MVIVVVRKRVRVCGVALVVGVLCRRLVCVAVFTASPVLGLTSKTRWYGYGRISFMRRWCSWWFELYVVERWCWNLYRSETCLSRLFVRRLAAVLVSY